MKRRLRLLLTIILPILASGQIQQEYRKILFHGDTTLKLNESIRVPASFHQNSNEPRKRYMRIIGGGIYPDKFSERGETRFREMECLIDDCIDSIHMEKGQYALNLYGENGNRIWKRKNHLLSSEMLPGTERDKT